MSSNMNLKTAMLFGYQIIEKHDWCLPENMLYISFKCTKLPMLAGNEVVVFILSVMLILTCHSSIQKQCQGD